MPPTKNNKTKKSSPSKSIPPKKKSQKKSTKPVKLSKTKIKKNNQTSLYILAIMALLTAFLILLNKFTTDKNPKPNKTTPTSDTLTDTDYKNISQKPAEPVEKNLNENEKVKIYFIKINEKTEKMDLKAVTRKVFSKNKIKESLKRLIEGPSAEEEDHGFLTAIPKDLKVYDLKIKNKTAEINFNQAIGKGATGNILLRRIDQIIYTATQFKGIENIIIKINGRYQKTLGSDGLSINGPLHR